MPRELPKIPLSSVALGERERAYVDDALASGWISSTGSYVSRFEAEIASRTRRRRAIATSSGSSALTLALRAMGIEAGDEVIVPALCFAAPASAVATLGARPVFADVSRESWTLDPLEVARVRTPRTRALIAADVLGHPCDYDALEELEIPILEDAAQAHGARYRDRPVGAFGVAAIFSFHANKTISCGEGGCVVTDDDRIAERITLINNHGMRPERPYWHEEIGENHKLTNLNAAVGLAQAERWDELVAARNRVAGRYDAAIAELPLERRPVAAWAQEGVWLYTVSCDETTARDRLLAACVRDAVDARAIWPPIPDQPAFQAASTNGSGGDFKVARDISRRTVWLPTWSGMPEAAIERVISTLRSGLRGG